MKRNIVFYIVLMFFIAPSIVRAETKPFKPDTIKIVLSNSVIIEIACLNAAINTIDAKMIKRNVRDFVYFSKQNLSNEILEEKHQVYTIERSIGNFFSTNDSTYFNCKYQYNISVKEMPKREVVVLSNDTNSCFSFYNDNILKFDNWRQSVKIYFKEFSQLDGLLMMDLLTILTDISDSIEKNLDSETITKRLKRLSFSSYYKVDDAGVPVHKYLQTYPNSDVLLLSIGAGIENIKGSWMGGFSASLGLKFAKKTVYKSLYSIGYDWLYDFTTPEEKNINHFLDFKYSRNFSKNPSRGSWYGISLGYLIKQQGDFFAENTFRLGVSKTIKGSFKIEPAMYFNNFFKDVYPGIKVSWDM